MGCNQIKISELEEFKNTTHILAYNKLMNNLIKRIKLENHRMINVDSETPDDFNQEILKCLTTCNLI